MTKNKFDYLQLLRAVAAIAVVMFHAAGATTKYSTFPARSIDFLHLGLYGVDLFFVISGFVMYYTAHNVSAGEFLYKRLERIVPLYWIFTFFAAIVVLSIPTSAEHLDWSKFAMSLGFISFLRGDFPLLYTGWTLEFEMLFYVCVTMSLLIARRPWPLTCAMISTAIIVGTFLPEHTGLTNFLTAPIMLEFLMGVLIGQTFINGRIGLMEAGFTALAAISVLLTSSELRCFEAGIPALFLVMSAVAARSKQLPRWVVSLGDASYAIYLVQIFTISTLSKCLHKISPGLDPDIFIVIATATTIAAGTASHYLLETPIKNCIRKIHSEKVKSYGPIKGTR